jgi:hypothetical protein
MHILHPAHHHHFPSSRRQAIVPWRIEDADPPAVDLGGRRIPGLGACFAIVAGIAVFIGGFLHGTIDTAVARWIG